MPRMQMHDHVVLAVSHSSHSSAHALAIGWRCLGLDRGTSRTAWGGSSARPARHVADAMSAARTSEDAVSPFTHSPLQRGSGECVITVMTHPTCQAG